MNVPKPPSRHPGRVAVVLLVVAAAGFFALAYVAFGDASEDTAVEDRLRANGETTTAVVVSDRPTCTGLDSYRAGTVRYCRALVRFDTADGSSTALVSVGADVRSGARLTITYDPDEPASAVAGTSVGNVRSAEATAAAVMFLTAGLGFVAALRPVPASSPGTYVRRRPNACLPFIFGALMGPGAGIVGLRWGLVVPVVAAVSHEVVRRRDRIVVGDDRITLRRTFAVSRTIPFGPGTTITDRGLRASLRFRGPDGRRMHTMLVSWHDAHGLAHRISHAAAAGGATVVTSGAGR